MSALADMFRKMADRIEANEGFGFGGAFVVAPPAEGGDPVTVLIVDESNQPAQFWAMLQTRCQLALAAIEEKARGQQGLYGRR